jgi:Cys-rich repeat protein
MRAPRLAFLVCWIAGCGNTLTTDPTTLVCDPACAPGFACTATGCVAGDGGSAGRDLSSMSSSDGGGGCGCSGTTPYCNADKVCVVCTQDAHCPAGQICKTVGNVSACVPGCKDDARCAGAGSPDGGAGMMKCCSGFCIDVGRDPQNCGACGTACGVSHSSATCTAGACVPGKCAPGWGDCNMDPKDGCETNLHVDAKNCGACGTACAFPNAVAACADACYLAACNFGFDDCNGDAKDGCETSVVSDVKNCGACGMACPAVANAVVGCLNAMCGLTSCKVGFADCDGNPKNGCEVAIGNDRNNCGKCGSACGQGQVCINGGCTCANCNIANATTKCVNNMCVFDQCVQGFADCDNNVNNGCEVDITGDAKNCGACGNVCPMGMPSCNMGKCVAGFDFGPSHSFTGLTSTHYITQGCCSVGCNSPIDVDAQYFCKHFYGDPMGLTCVPVKGYIPGKTPGCSDAKMHKNGGCTGNGNNIPNTQCEGGPCKIGNWNECTSGITNLVCHCT